MARSRLNEEACYRQYGLVVMWRVYTGWWSCGIVRAGTHVAYLFAKQDSHATRRISATVAL